MMMLNPAPWFSSGHPSKRRLHQGVVCHEDLPDAQHSDHHGVVLEEDHADDPRSCPAREVSGTCAGPGDPTEVVTAPRQSPWLGDRNCLFILSLHLGTLGAGHLHSFSFLSC